MRIKCSCMHGTLDLMEDLCKLYARQLDNWTTGQLNNRTTRQLNNQTTGQAGNWTITVMY